MATKFPRRFGLILLGIALVALAVNEGLHWYSHVYEPNAKVVAEFTVLSSSVNGNIEHILAREGDSVNPGQKLASLDTTGAELSLLSLQADLEKERAVRHQVEVELAYFKTELENKISTARESVRQRNRELATLNERWEIARTNVERNSMLANRSMVARQRIDDASDKLLEITSKRRDLQTEIRIQEKHVEELEGRRSRKSIYHSRLSVIDRNIDKIMVSLERAQHQLRDMHIYSPIKGIVNEIHVNPGAYVEDGDPVFLVHEPTKVWVEANIDESDIRHVQVGQVVIVDLDAYPFEHFEGSVRSIGQVTASAISTNNAPRNGVGAQKIPVVIDLAPIGKPVWPGMRVAVNIVIR